jgi:alpha-amylase
MQSQFNRVEWRHHVNIYEVNTRQYTPEGNFQAFAREMPRLKDMGVEVLWFMPITPISIQKRKGSLGSYYACSDYTSINPEYGTMEDFKTLVTRAHELNMKVIIDWVANHTGWDHVWTKTNPDYFLKDQLGNFHDRYGWDDVIDLDYSNHNLRTAIKESMKFWIRTCNIDGFRCDMAMLTPYDFWKEARTELDQLKPLLWLGEMDQWDNPDYMEVFDLCYSWKWMHKTKEFYQTHKPDIHGLLAVLVHYESLRPKSAIRTWFTSNHDENSWNGTEYEKYGHLAKPLAVFSCTWNGVPMIYSGQELPNHKRLKFFDKDPIEWDGSYELHDFYKKLLNLHSNHPALRAADDNVTTYFLRTSSEQEVFAFLRKNGEKEVLVLLNLSPHENLAVQIHNDMVHGTYAELFSGETHEFRTDSVVEMKAWGHSVFFR